jgi:hypothetical protein
MRPPRPIGPGRRHALVRDIGLQISDGTLMKIEVIALALERGVEMFRIDIAPVGQDHGVVTLAAMALPAARLDHQRSVQPGLLLKA